MEQRPLEYTVKIYCEGFTEWYYFEWLRTNNRFKFSMEPDIHFSSSTPIPWSRTKRNTPFIKKQRRNTKSKELFSSRVTLASKFGFFITS